MCAVSNICILYYTKMYLLDTHFEPGQTNMTFLRAKLINFDTYYISTELRHPLATAMRIIGFVTTNVD